MIDYKKKMYNRINTNYDKQLTVEYLLEKQIKHLLYKYIKNNLNSTVNF